jgi:hypothetical protein
MMFTLGLLLAAIACVFFTLAGLCLDGMPSPNDCPIARRHLFAAALFFAVLGMLAVYGALACTSDL